MNARQAANMERWAGEDAARAAGHCLLCDGPVHVKVQDGEPVVWNLCDLCNRIFQGLAASLEAAGSQPAPAGVQVAGQLELDDDGGEVSVLVLGRVLEGLRTGTLAGIPTQDLADVLRYEAEGLRLTEVDLLKGELWRRS